jgi:hypothetical protein
LRKNPKADANMGQGSAAEVIEGECELGSGQLGENPRGAIPYLRVTLKTCEEIV